ncbi:adenylyl-sulfate kinase [Athalassotoga saccharophila]|uniref:adenylyl-sulfate kinase n=1 Tax=Athalassotoga saccharophila TaxID=1441386 RepID=UPI00137AB39A|nr:adenylyl-sulfate kinase [Athalassotoga saccharophila]
MKSGFVLWFTGLSGSGKTTLSKSVENKLKSMGIAHVQSLDGDIVRKELTKDLGFSKADRDENIRRVGFVAKLLSDNGIPTLCAFISPYKDVRNEIRQKCVNFIEVFVKCPIEILMERDPKGLYKKALNGEISNFTGVNDPYEEPENPEIIVDTSVESVEESTEKIISYLVEKGLIVL